MFNKHFGWQKPARIEKPYKKTNFYIFIFLLLISFFIFSIVKNISFAIKQKNINLENLAHTIYYTDKNLSNLLLSANSIKNKLEKRKNPFLTNEGDFLIILNYISKHNLPHIHFLQKYKKFYQFSQEFIKTYTTKKFYQLVKPNKTYLIILENIGEVRPNGGFFGSFGTLTINQNGINLKIQDAYYPIFIKKVNLYLTSDYVKALTNKSYINFISPNIFGFTNIDGPHIAQLYEKTFGKKIDGIIFVKSSLFENLSPLYRNKIYERQFVNASIDLIRGSAQPFKKELYLKQVNQFIKQNKFTILRQILANWDQILNNGYIQVWIPALENNKKTKQFLAKHHLILERQNNCFYFFDHNFGYNKIDRFLEKQIFIIQNDKILHHTNKNFLCLNTGQIEKLKKGFEIKIHYFLNIPQSYIDFIHQLEQKYKITLTPREKHILGLNPKVKNKGIIWFPKNLEKDYIIYSYYLPDNLTSTNISIKIY